MHNLNDNVIRFILDKLWPSDKYGFKFSYAIKLKNKWMIKKPGNEWEEKKANWKPNKEIYWCKYSAHIYVRCM